MENSALCQLVYDVERYKTLKYVDRDAVNKKVSWFLTKAMKDEATYHSKVAERVKELERVRVEYKNELIHKTNETFKSLSERVKEYQDLIRVVNILHTASTMVIGVVEHFKKCILLPYNKLQSDRRIPSYVKENIIDMFHRAVELLALVDSRYVQMNDKFAQTILVTFGTSDKKEILTLQQSSEPFSLLERVIQQCSSDEGSRLKRRMYSAGCLIGGRTLFVESRKRARASQSSLGDIHRDD